MNLPSLIEHTKKMRILYAEDDDAVRESTGRLFENFFASVDYAKDGEEGLYRYLKSHELHNTPHIVFSDITMPHIDGITMAQAILAKEPEQQVVFITAYHELEELTRASVMGIEEFLHKPIEMDQLVSLLSNTLEAYQKKYPGFF